MGTIVVGVDGSPASQAALRWARREAELRGERIVAVLAWGFLDQHAAPTAGGFDPHYSADDAAAALAAHVADALGSDGLDVESRPVCDLAKRALVDASAGASLLVVGSRGRGGFEGLLLGSVSRHCLHHAACPVAVVRVDTVPADGAGRVLVGVDGSPAADAALAWAVEEGAHRGVSVEVLHAWQLPFRGADPFTMTSIEPEAFEAKARVMLAETIVAATGAGTAAPEVEVRPTLTHGGASAALLERAGDAALVVIGSHGTAGHLERLLGSVAEQVVRHARCPVVVVPSR